MVLKDLTLTLFSNRMREVVQEKNVLLLPMAPNKKTTVTQINLASVTQTYW